MLYNTLFGHYSKLMKLRSFRDSDLRTDPMNHLIGEGRADIVAISKHVGESGKIKMGRREHKKGFLSVADIGRSHTRGIRKPQDIYSNVDFNTVFYQYHTPFPLLYLHFAPFSNRHNEQCGKRMFSDFIML